MAEVVYILCALAALMCAVMLARAYRRTPSRLLLWSCVCFVALALNSILVIMDVLFLHDTDLRLPRLVVAGTGVLTLLWALIRDSN
ncbi:MAG: hypothetical protein AMXMBFR58_33880 [Phycisphaerae bacterium]|nr:hypothetical protein [Phycisphaerales bacterium]MCK6477737.1 DUF5985 family protein [Phycisphaerales bacterium]